VRRDQVVGAALAAVVAGALMASVVQAPVPAPRWAPATGAVPADTGDAVMAQAADTVRVHILATGTAAPPHAPPPPVRTQLPSVPIRSAPAQSPVPAASPSGAPTAALAVFQTLNAERVSQGLAPLRWSTRLAASAHLHDLAMAAADQLSHQLPGEPALGTRISAQGVAWSWCAENIGWSSAMSSAGALGMEAVMFAEKPPDDDHRLNILTTSGTIVGIDVLMDSAHHVLWLTEDFAN
jgi:uncharacterized protein YkwD